MDYQIINGKKFPPFHFYAKSRRSDFIYKITGMLSEYAFTAVIGNGELCLFVEDAVPLSLTEMTFDEQPTEKKYRPWTHEDIGSLLFFKDKIFRHKEMLHKQSFVRGYDSDSFIIEISGWCSLTLKQILDEFEYSTGGANWLPCGVEIQ